MNHPPIPPNSKWFLSCADLGNEVRLPTGWVINLDTDEISDPIRRYIAALAVYEWFIHSYFIIGHSDGLSKFDDVFVCEMMEKAWIEWGEQ